jgi:hypothetical protein
MIHYHGGPITPETCAYRTWRGRHAFISYAHGYQIELAAGISQSFALDNGAYSFWKKAKPVDWDGYYDWCEEWLDHPGCDWAVIPDVIDGSEAENDALILEWPHGQRGVPVWHLNESVERLIKLAHTWPRVALGSTAEWDVSKPKMCLQRLYQVLPAICCGGRPITKLHGLRMLRPEIITKIPLASGDSTNVAFNIGLDKRWNGAPYAPATKETRAEVLVERVETQDTPGRLIVSAQPIPLFGSEIAV